MTKFHIYKTAPKDFPNDFDYICLTQKEYEDEESRDMEEDDVFTYEYLGVFSRDRRETH